MESTVSKCSATLDESLDVVGPTGEHLVARVLGQTDIVCPRTWDQAFVSHVLEFA